MTRGEQGPRSGVALPDDGPLDYLASGALWAAGLAWLVPMLTLQRALYRVAPLERLQWLERLYTRGQVALTGSSLRYEVDPAVDPRRPYAFFQNHVSHIDHCTLYAATPHVKQGVELAEHFDYPVYGGYMRARGTIPVARESLSQLRELSRRMAAELDKGRSLIVFPEGTRTQTGQLGTLQPGVFRIVQQLGAAIVPVTVTGIYRVMRKGSHLIRPGHAITVYVDAPIETQGLHRREVPALLEQVRKVMQGRLDTYWARTR
jgi:1-acyl-sn-glycerol-3-phosphate acyltransferase